MPETVEPLTPEEIEEIADERWTNQSTIDSLLATIAATEARAVAAEERADAAEWLIEQMRTDERYIMATWNQGSEILRDRLAAAETLTNRYREALQEIIDFCRKTPGTYLGSIEQTARAALEDGTP